MPEGARARNRREVRERIAEAAVRLYSERGFDATSVAAIAEAAGVSPATFFRYFPTKESVVVSGIEDDVPRVREAARQCLDPADLRTSLVAFVRVVCSAWEVDAGFTRARVALLRDAAVVPSALAALEGWQHALAGELGELQSRQPTVADHALAAAVVAVIGVAVDEWRASEASLADLAAEALGSVLDLAPAAV